MEKSKKSVKYQKHWTREYSIWYGAAASQGLYNCYFRLLQQKVPVRAEFANSLVTTYSPAPMYQSLLQYFQKKIIPDISSIEQEIASLFEKGEQFIDFTKSLQISTTTALEHLQQLYQQYFDLYVQLCYNLWISFYLVDLTAEKLELELKKELPLEKVYPAIEYYSQPAKKAVILKISDYFSGEKNILKRVKFIQNNYPWLGCKDIFEDAWTEQETINYAKSFTTHQNKVIKKVHFSNKDLVRAYQEILYVKDRRDELRREAFYFGLPLVKELARRMNIRPKDLSNLLPQEIHAANFKETIQKRQQACLLVVDSRGMKIEEGKETLKKFINTINRNMNNLDVSQLIELNLSGTIGSRGIVKGRVKIITTTEHLASVEKGSILVSVTTDPSYLPAMQKAAAFVTDEGGITCHAAIVAREMHKPCIVGTKVATSILKDGQLVEVDAMTGIVRIIQK